MFHTPRNLAHPHRQLLGCISQDTAHIIPRYPFDKGEPVTLSLWIDSSPVTTQYRANHQRPTCTIHSPVQLLHRPTPQTIPKTMHEVVLLFINSDPNDIYCGLPFIKYADLQQLLRSKEPASSTAAFYAFCISQHHIFTTHQRDCLRLIAAQLGCPVGQLAHIPFYNHPKDSPQAALLDFENEAFAASHPNLKPFAKTVAQAIAHDPSKPRRGRPPKHLSPGGQRDKLFAAFTFQSLGSGQHNLPNGHTAKSKFHGGWPNPTVMLAHERHIQQQSCDAQHIPLPPLTTRRQCKHNADLLIYEHILDLPTLATFINHPSTVGIDQSYPPDHSLHHIACLTDQTIARLVELTAQVDPLPKIGRAHV